MRLLPNGSRLSCERPDHRRKGVGRQPVPRQGHNTPLPLKRSPPASFKRLLGGAACITLSDMKTSALTIRLDPDSGAQHSASLKAITARQLQALVRRQRDHRALLRARWHCLSYLTYTLTSAGWPGSTFTTRELLDMYGQRCACR